MPIQTTPEGSPPTPISTPDEGGAEQGAADAGGQDPNADQGQANPVIDALKVIQTFIASLKEKGDPKAQEIIAAFQALVGALGGGGQDAGQAPPAADQGGDQGAGPASTGKMPMGANQNSVPIV